MEESIHATLHFLRHNNQKEREVENENVFENSHGLLANICYDKPEASLGSRTRATPSHAANSSYSHQ